VTTALVAAAVGALGLAVGVALGVTFARRGSSSGTEDAAGVPDPYAMNLILGLIAAHDLAAQSRAVAVETHVEAVLARAGVRRLTATADEPFDAAVHEAVGAEPVSGGYDRGSPVVARQIRSGWSHDDVVLRQVQVVVSR
jgi:hypothetical protein